MGLPKQPTTPKVNSGRAAAVNMFEVASAHQRSEKFGSHGAGMLHQDAIGFPSDGA